MKRDDKDGGPAFPQINYWDSTNWGMGPSGMSLRDWFAGMALQGICANPNQIVMDGPDYYKQTAEVAYQLADEMLMERTK